MIVLAATIGFAIGFAAWATASHFIATSLNRAEERNPELIGSKRLRAAEVTACAIVFLACLALAVWVGWVLWLEVR